MDLDVKRGERICIVGANGIGKTTLLKMILGETSCTTGRIRIGHNVQFGYYDQGQQLLNGSNTVIGELQDAYRLYNDTEMRNILGRFLFRGESVFLQISSLSGGEKARLALLKLMLSGANVLILDEPTNHLDIESKEVFEEALLDFPGTSVIVSHDRYFLNRIPTRIVELTENGMDSYLGTYDYYVEKKQAQIQSGKKYMDELSSREKAQMDAPQSALQDSAKDTPEGMSSLSAAEQRKLKKEQEAKDRRIRRQKESLEADIASLENDISCLEAELCLEENMKDHVKLTALSEELADKKGELELKYEEWLILQE
ncbi:MAG: ATP-binding cassette domain-containing protein [Clostridia bacterium]